MTHPRRIILFDIDGTLLLTGGAGARALTRCFKEIFGIDDALDGIRLHGATDPVIIEDVFKRAGLSHAAERERLQVLDETYLRYLAEEMRASPRARLLPGVLALLSTLKDDPRVLLALLTGNIEAAARIKLSRFDLNPFFSLGAYGSDSSCRRELVPIALSRVESALSRRVPPDDVVLIGDTEKDIDCGKHSGVRTVAVATGGSTPQELQAAGADHIFPDLSDSRSVLQTLLAGLQEM